MTEPDNTLLSFICYLNQAIDLQDLGISIGIIAQQVSTMRLV